MEYKAKIGRLEKLSTDCLVITVSDPCKLSAAGEAVDKVSNGYLSGILRQGDMQGHAAQCLLLHNIQGVTAKRILLVGIGKQENFDEAVFSKVINGLISSLSESGAKDAHISLTDAGIKNRGFDWQIRQTVILTSSHQYRFEQMKSKESDRKPRLAKLSFQVTNRGQLAKADNAIQQGAAIGAGMDQARDLGNLPGNICTPSYIAKQAKLLAKGQKRLTVKVLEEADMRRLKMGSLLSVSAGSRQPAKLITLEYKGAAARQKPVVLVGKGVTFDTGGISLKAGAAMDEMKFDMCGAASVMGTISAVVQLQLPVNVVGIIPATENMPDGLATKPGDIVTSMSGQTIEILNTDAEGRLILCDALSYAAKFNPKCVIDIATLTGACIIALGKVPSAVLGNHDPLIQDLLKSGQQIEDKLWELPLWDEYQEQLKSNFADIANIGGRDAGTITAACFLSRFTKNYHWAHLDIAGTAWKSGDQKGATGRPVPLLTQYILNQV
ncbi:MAG: leucyl aminopeptidase [Gammaproteobacteria bacterium]|nr:leucyl aminopeptidase [Gammaproteobacteria bacterium]